MESTPEPGSLSTRLNFKLAAEAPGSKARAGRFKTLHNEVLTPLFMPVGTNATVRHQTFDIANDSGSQILLANTYHLLIRPGPDVFKAVGGLHGLTKWKKSFLTDSGGFQIFSLPNARIMTEEGAKFRSYVDGEMILLSPEKSIETQKAMGSDIMMVLDQCIPSTSEKSLAFEAMKLTHRWAKRSLTARGDSPQSIFGIVQGACYEDLRRESARVMTEMPFDGFAIGGLAVGETKTQREDFCELTASLLPRELPRYLMGVGTPIDLLEAVHRGVDMFDCILPTALAQQGVAYTRNGRLRMSRGVYKTADIPLDPACPCPTCTTYSRAYLHHLNKVGEPFGTQIIGTHNLYFYHQMMREIRESILNGSFLTLYKSLRETLVQGDDANPVVTPVLKRRRNKVTELGRFEITTSEIHGHSSVKHKDSGEVMHSVSPPNEEAERLYVSQSKLVEKLSAHVESEPLVIWDVGLGAAHNAMKAIQTALQMAPEFRRPLHIVSFENDLDSLKLALERPDLFPHIRHEAPNSLVDTGAWESKDGKISWCLIQGDFFTSIDVALDDPHIIFFDPFSSQTNPSLWSLECFKRIYARGVRKNAELFTYSASTAVRSTLLAAGFFVGKGSGSGPKSETTVAIACERKPNNSPLELLSAQWLQKWERSDAKHPLDFEHGDDNLKFFETQIRTHPQFSKPS